MNPWKYWHLYLCTVRPENVYESELHRFHFFYFEHYFIFYIFCRHLCNSKVSQLITTLFQNAKIFLKLEVKKKINYFLFKRPFSQWNSSPPIRCICWQILSFCLSLNRKIKFDCFTQWGVPRKRECIGY